MYEQIGVHVMQSQPLHRTHFSQYQASSPALGITARPGYSLIPRTFLALIFDHLQYTKTEHQCLGNLIHMQ